MQQNEISDLEKVVMDILWQRGECSARDIVGDIQQTRHIAYTTVTTILKRLVKKGMLNRRADGIMYQYSPILSKESYSKKLAQTFIVRFISSYGDTAIASFAESLDALPKEKRDYLLAVLKKHGKSK